MELRHIRYFLAVAEEGNFTRAAARVGIGQPPLSQQIRDLEAEVGAPLFHRVPPGAELTEAGRAFRDSVADIPDRAGKALRAARRAAQGETGALRAGFTSSAMFNPAVTAAFRAFGRAYPGVILTLEETNTTRLAAGLHAGRLDVAFLREGAAGAEGLLLRPLAEEPLLAVVPAAHPAAAASCIALADLRDMPFLLTPRDVGPTLFDTVIEACRLAGFEPILGQTAPQFGSVIHLVAAELGVSLVPASLQVLNIAGVAYRPIAGTPPKTALALACRRGEGSPVVRNFLACAQT